MKAFIGMHGVIIYLKVIIAREIKRELRPCRVDPPLTV